MDIIFASSKFKTQCNNYRLLQRKQGERRAKRIRQRLDDLQAARTLEDMRNLPGRCHELTGNRADQLSLDLDHPYRLILEPANHPILRKNDGGLEWRKITAIMIIGIEDTHG